MIRALLLAAALFAWPASAQEPPPPKLLIVISVDQLSGDLFDEYQREFTSGFARIASGAMFSNASQAKGDGPSLGELMKAHWAGSRTVEVSGQRGASDPIAGPNIDQGWSWSATRFEPVSANPRVPLVVRKVNNAVAAALAQPRPPLQPTPFCQSRPGKTRLARGAGDASGLAASPELDGDVLALAAGLVDEMQLGRRSDPDLVSIRLFAAANVGRAYGEGSEEMCLELTELDREIGDFLSLLDSRGIDYAVALDGVAGGRVPMAFWRPGFRGASVNVPVDTSDIVPTLATLIGLPASRALPGRCLEGTPAFCPQR